MATTGIILWMYELLYVTLDKSSDKNALKLVQMLCIIHIESIYFFNCSSEMYDTFLYVKVKVKQHNLNTRMH